MKDKSLSRLRHKELEKKQKKVKKKDLIKILAQYIQKEELKNDGYWVNSVNFKGDSILIHCATKDECYQNLAILNGITI